MAGKIALVTGASSGLGEHFAKILAADGYQVILAARRREKLLQVENEISAQGGSVSVVEMDVVDPESVKNAFGSIPGRIDVVINNAGISGGGAAVSTSSEDFEAVIDTNLKGVFWAAQMAAQRMREQDGGGAIVNIASILGLRVAGGLAAYTASKAGVVQLTKALALEWARYGIRVNALCPGYIKTPLNEEFFSSEAGQALIRRIPQRRLGQLSDLDGPLRLLCSDASSYMTGSVISVDGGHLVSSL